MSCVSIANHVASNLSSKTGDKVGYSVRFDYNYTPETQVKFMTEGMLIREILIDPLLSEYSVVIVDDCHDRTVNCELILGLLIKFMFNKNICQKTGLEASYRLCNVRLW